ncbi:MAG: DNA polymerase III subunit beta [Pseudomonadota bacterium]
MKFTIERTDLLRSLNHVHSVVERRNAIPILANVMLRAEKDSLSLTTTDMDLEIVESVAARTSVTGTTTVPVHTLYDIARKLGEGAVVEFSSASGDTTMLVKSGKSTFRLGCLPTEDFPKMGSSEKFSCSFSIPAADLRTLVDRTRFAISSEETRYYLNGIYLHAAENENVQVLRAVATDGHRLARFEMPLPEGARGMPGVIIPRKAINEIRKLIDEAGDAIEIGLSDNKMKFSFDHVSLTTKLIDGTFPDYNRVIPKGNEKILEVSPDIFSSAVDRVSTISSEKSRAVKLAISGKTMTLSANSPDSGSASEEIEIRFNAAPMEIGFNSAYLMDVTRQIEGEGCRISLSDSASPAVIQDVSDTSSLYVLMPLRV